MATEPGACDPVAHSSQGKVARTWVGLGSALSGSPRAGREGGKGVPQALCQPLS